MDKNHMYAPVSTGSVVAFIVVLLGLVGAVLRLHHRSGGRLRDAVIWGGTWIALTGVAPFVLASFGGGAKAQLPIFALMMVFCLWFSSKKWGARLAAVNGLAVLAGVQVFRLPLEVVLSHWAAEGFLPIQMTYHGDNFDIVTGMLALPVAYLIHKGIRARLIAWTFNILGLLFLARILSIVALSSPTPIKKMFIGYATGPDVLVGLYFPTVWLASIAVFAAVFLHVVSLRHLARTSHSKPNG